MYFTADQVIDQIQNAKKTAVNTIMFDNDARKASIEFIDVQTKVAKMNAKFIQDSSELIISEGKKAYEQFSKFDYSKFFKQPISKSSE